MKKFVEVGITPEIKKIGVQKCYMNNKYVVDVTPQEKDKGMDGWVWLSIKRKDKRVIKDWREMQKIKNSICGEEREGLELYPSEKRLVDTSNQFHIFVMPKGEMFPFGYQERAIVEGHKGGWEKGSGQRAFKEGEQPKDAMTIEEAKKLVEKYLSE